MNIFEGARRITKIIAVMWFIGWAYNLATWSPSPHNGFDITAAKPDEPQEWLAQKRLKDSTPELSDTDLLALKKGDLAAVSDEGLIAMYQANEVMKTAARWEAIKFNSLWTFGGLAFLFIFSWCIGWIVRGFAGIPSGQDKKPDDI